MGSEWEGWLSMGMVRYVGKMCNSCIIIKFSSIDFRGSAFICVYFAIRLYNKCLNDVVVTQKAKSNLIQYSSMFAHQITRKLFFYRKFERVTSVKLMGFYVVAICLACVSY